MCVCVYVCVVVGVACVLRVWFGTQHTVHELWYGSLEQVVAVPRHVLVRTRVDHGLAVTLGEGRPGYG